MAAAKMELLDCADGQRIAMFFCPGCQTHHGPVVQPVRWAWNGSLDAPTFTPSILVTGKRPITDDEANRIMAGEVLDIPDLVCHSFVTDGRIQFLSDCTHALAGQTVELPDYED